mgnify:CR=1 FL=1
MDGEISQYTRGYPCIEGSRIGCGGTRMPKEMTKGNGHTPSDTITQLRKKLAKAYAAYFAGAPVYEEVVQLERLLVIELGRP